MAIPKPELEVSEIGTTAVDAPPPNVEQWTQNKGFFGHPRGLSTLFFTEMWERFSYYGIRPLLVLFMTAALTGGGFGMERNVASAIVGIYAASVYLASLPGGWIADRWLGLRRAVFWGGVLISLGHISIALSIVFARPAFFLGLVFIVVGTGLLKPNVSAIVGDLYPEGGARRDAGFSVFYMGINVGALLAPLFTGYLGERVAWHLGFGVAGLAMIIGLVQYRLTAAKTLGPLGVAPSGTPAEQRRIRNYTLGAATLFAIVILLTMTGLIHFDPIALAEKIFVIIVTLAALYFGYLFLFAGLNGAEKKGMAVVFVLFIFSAIFWAAFEQAPTSLNLFARDFTDRHIFGWEMPTLFLQSVNSIFVIIFAPLFGVLWLALAKRGIDLSSPTKFTFGLLMCGIAFLLMVVPSNIVIAGGAGTRVSAWWLTVSYLLQTFGELSLSPVGLSSMTQLAPRKFVGQMMGVWFTATALGNLIAGLVGGRVNPENLAQMPELFQRTAMSLFIAAVVLALLIVPIRNMMKGKRT
jgi:proton-dependent oligopeptide transporter, POT family